jgi:hypothetical protein
MIAHPRLSSLALVAAVFVARSAGATVIAITPASGSTAYTLIEGANPGDEVTLAPGTYAFRVYLQQQAPASNPICIHSLDPTNPAVVDLSSAPGGLVDNAPGDYTGGDTARGCWQLSGATNIHIDGIVFQNCHAASNDSAGIRYYNGTTGFLLTNCLFKSNDNGLTGGTLGGAGGNTQCDATVEWSEFDSNGNLAASESAPTHNIYIYGGDLTLRYSYLHDPIQGQNLHCRAINSTIEYNWLSRAKSYAGDLMTNDDYANNPVGSLAQSMIFRGNVINEGAQENDSQILALYNDEASGSPVTFHITALYNTLYGTGGDAALVHLADSDGTVMSAELDDNLIYGTSVATLIDNPPSSTVTGANNWLQTGTATHGLVGSVFGTNPGFKNAASLDFVPLASSPCVGAANDTVAGLPVDEYYENEIVTRMYRVRASAKDIGAFEHDTTGPGIGPYTLVDGGVDTGDSGSGAHDSGTDGPHGSNDSGTSQSDGSAPTAEGGAAATPPHTSGCGCHLVETSKGGGGVAWVFGWLGLARRRRIVRSRRPSPGPTESLRAPKG